MLFGELRTTSTQELIDHYNKLVSKRKKVPSRMRRNVMPRAANTLAVLRDEIHTRALSEGSQILEHLQH